MNLRGMSVVGWSDTFNHWPIFSLIVCACKKTSRYFNTQIQRHERKKSAKMTQKLTKRQPQKMIHIDEISLQNWTCYVYNQNRKVKDET